MSHNEGAKIVFFSFRSNLFFILGYIYDHKSIFCYTMTDQKASVSMKNNLKIKTNKMFNTQNIFGRNLFCILNI